MKEIIEYRVISGADKGHLIGLVNIAIEEGWQPLGGIALDRNNIMQAMVKYKNATSEK